MVADWNFGCRPQIILYGVLRVFVFDTNALPCHRYVMAIMSLSNVSKSYGELTVLDGVSLEIGVGEAVAVVGPSGSGKSTLLHLMGALDVPSSGEIAYKGDAFGGMNEKQRAAFRAEQLGFVFQAHRLLPQCSAVENTLLPKLATGKASADDEQRAKALLQRVGLGDRLHHRPGELSGGECQRVALVRALINRPGLLLADEPTGALDEANADGLVELLLQLNKEEGTALVVVTHDPDVAAQMGRTLRLRAGRLEA